MRCQPKQREWGFQENCCFPDNKGQTQLAHTFFSLLIPSTSSLKCRSNAWRCHSHFAAMRVKVTCWGYQSAWFFLELHQPWTTTSRTYYGVRRISLFFWVYRSQTILGKNSGFYELERGKCYIIFTNLKLRLSIPFHYECGQQTGVVSATSVDFVPRNPSCFHSALQLLPLSWFITYSYHYFEILLVCY